MNVFLKELSEQYPEDAILLCCDGAAWHKSKTVQLPDSIRLFHIPPYTSEMNPIEQIWKELRTRGFHNGAFQTLENVIVHHVIPSAIFPLILFIVSLAVTGSRHVLIRD